MKIKVYQLTYNDQIYEVPVTFKRQRNLYVRYRDNAFTATVPTLCPEKTVLNFLSKSLPKLIERNKKKTPVEPPLGSDYYYLLGEKIYGTISEKDLKKVALQKFTCLTRQYEKNMNIKKPYNIHVRKMKTRYGSNSSYTHSICYSLELIHYSEDIILSVVIHELCHDTFRNHQKGFYNCLYKYCPNYNVYRKKLIKREYK